MSSRPELRTARLVLRPFGPSDRDELLELFRDREVRRYLLDDLLVTRAWLDEEIHGSTKRFDDGSAGLWVVLEASAPAIVGFAGFRPFFEPPELQLVAALHPGVWGRGYATEAAAAVIELGFDRFGLEEIRAATDAPNERSIRLLRRLGFEETRRSEQGPAGTVFFRLAAEDWRRR